MLSEASAGGALYFSYDRAGQLCWRGQTDGSNLSDTCGSGPAGSTNFSHDAAGNNTNFASNPTIYNNDSQITTIDGVNMGYLDRGNDLRTTAGGVSYVNSPLGVTAKKEGTNITYYMRDTRGSILASYGASGTLFYFSEFNSSVTALYNTSGNEVGSHEYSPYGKTTATGTAAENNPFRYIGGLQDKDRTGADTHYKLGARYYDTQGHLTQPDPIIPGGGSYEYTSGDPVNSSDPTGLVPEPDPYGLCDSKGSTGYYTPNCGGYITGSGGGQSAGNTALCAGIGVLNIDVLLAGATGFVSASIYSKAFSIVGLGLQAGTLNYNPLAPTATACS